MMITICARDLRQEDGLEHVQNSGKTRVAGREDGKG